MEENVEMNDLGLDQGLDTVQSKKPRVSQFDNFLLQLEWVACRACIMSSIYDIAEYFKRLTIELTTADTMILNQSVKDGKVDLIDTLG